MNWAGKKHPVETIAEWVAPIPLAFAAAWSGMVLGLPLAGAMAISIALLAAGLAAVRLAGGGTTARPCSFEPVTFDAESSDLDELILEAKDELLELTDPLVDVEEDSRVVRLFVRQEPTPGELVNRISNFLETGQRLREVGTDPVETQMPVDASTALHAALANIRASLR